MNKKTRPKMTIRIKHDILVCCPKCGNSMYMTAQNQLTCTAPGCKFDGLFFDMPYINLDLVQVDQIHDPKTPAQDYMPPSPEDLIEEKIKRIIRHDPAAVRKLDAILAALENAAKNETKKIPGRKDTFHPRPRNQSSPMRIGFPQKFKVAPRPTE